jgi:outer membrane murein-binding lipoprotein Lpp
MTIRRRNARLTISALLLGLSAVAGCGGNNDDDEATEKKAKLVEGTFVGKATGTTAFVAVVASPAAKGKRHRDVTVFVCDAKSLCEWLSGSANGNTFSVPADDDDAKANGRLTAKAVRGNIELRGGKTVKYVAAPAAATAGLYALTVSPKGKLTGASAAGVGLTGKSTLPSPGPGTLKLADGTRLKFDTTENSDDPIRLRAGDVRVIVLPGRQLRGAGKSRGGEDGASGFFMRSPSG